MIDLYSVLAGRSWLGAGNRRLLRQRHTGQMVSLLHTIILTRDHTSRAWRVPDRSEQRDHDREREHRRQGAGKDDRRDEIGFEIVLERHQ